MSPDSVLETPRRPCRAAPPPPPVRPSATPPPPPLPQPRPAPPVSAFRCRANPPGPREKPAPTARPPLPQRPACRARRVGNRGFGARGAGGPGGRRRAPGAGPASPRARRRCGVSTARCGFSAEAAARPLFSCSASLPSSREARKAAASLHRCDLQLLHGLSVSLCSRGGGAGVRGGAWRASSSSASQSSIAPSSPFIRATSRCSACEAARRRRRLRRLCMCVWVCAVGVC